MFDNNIGTSLFLSKVTQPCSVKSRTLGVSWVGVWIPTGTNCAKTHSGWKLSSMVHMVFACVYFSSVKTLPDSAAWRCRCHCYWLVPFLLLIQSREYFLYATQRWHCWISQSRADLQPTDCTSGNWLHFKYSQKNTLMIRRFNEGQRDCQLFAENYSSLFAAL